ncbi:MAG: hypothetical protein JWL98_772, partial [Xanthomonadaceae bacterium]|nr:hypothetical protein [Xanthomonadaceae bacterium]
SFSYQITNTYTATCTWKATHERIRYPIVHTSGLAVNSGLVFLSGGHRLFGGYSLSGFGAPFESGDTLPTLGASCKKGKAGGVWTDLTQVGSAAGLYANYGTSQTLIY